MIRVPVAQPDDLVFETLFREPVVVALPLDHRLVQGRSAPTVRLSDLHDEALILARRPGAPGLYANLLALCRAAGVKPRIAAEVDRMVTNLNLVAAGAGISVVPASMQGLHADAIVYCPLLEGQALDAPMTLVHRRLDRCGASATFLALTRRLALPWQVVGP